MMEKLDRKQQRGLAIGILVVAVALLLAVTAGPIWLANASRQDAINQAGEQLKRYRQIAARDAELLPQYESLLRRQKASGNHLRSDTVALAGAELQRRMNSISSANGARVLSTQILPSANEESFIKIALKVRLSGTLPSILESLYEVETDDVYMFVDNVELNDPRAGRSPYKTEIRPVNANFDLIAYMPEES